ncbi:hypothetical protein GN277_25835 [Lachnospiraceae bacterium WCA-9-b2]|uniref:Sigma factor regulator C-terminal domain-containing protein n=1 Tax=Sporofaciens musculi TaxID=2681861 RepID=A0A7X3MLS9_9FIRM|nr:anti sigma factor C-terminal domain-containing protein [Sporofaciens musculi]MXP78635.1 hypothetical protein [Sporofaciens musculi]
MKMKDERQFEGSEKYGDKFEKYLSGELKVEEFREIEEDIEKFQVLIDYVNHTLDEELYEKEDEGGRKNRENSEKISKAIGRKFRNYMIGAAAAAICIVPLLLMGLSPLLNWIYYNPNQSKEIIVKENDSVIVTNPFAAAMSVYMELFCGDKGFAELCLWPEGYGRYTIDVQTQIDGENTSHILELVRNHLYQNDLSWNSSDFPANAFTYRSEGPSLCMDKDTARKKLEEAPELMKIRASISFDKLKNMDELAEFMGKHETYYLYCPVDVKGYRYWGFSPEKRGYDLTYGYDLEKYPYLDISEGSKGDERSPIDAAVREKVTMAEVYEKHVESMIRFLMEDEDFLKIFDGCAPGGKNFINTYEYVEALDYIREHGVKSYGVVVYAAKQELLEMLEDSSVDGVYMLDGKIDLKF